MQPIKYNIPSEQNIICIFENNKFIRYKYIIIILYTLILVRLLGYFR